MAQDQVSHCPNCLAEYRWGVSVCTECGTQVVPGPSPAMEDDWADDPDDPAGDLGGIGEPAQVEVVRLPAQSPASDGEHEPEDLFGQEEHPTRVILCRLEEDDAAGLVDALDEEGIGARLGDTASDGTAEVMVHDTRLGEAQAVMVDWTGDPSLVDGVVFEGAAPAGADDPGRDGYLEVSSGSMSSMSLQAQRLSEEGIRARLVLPPEGADPASVTSGASLYVSREDLTEARHILGMAI
jgi:hypothetical protein